MEHSRCSRKDASSCVVPRSMGPVSTCRSDASSPLAATKAYVLIQMSQVDTSSSDNANATWRWNLSLSLAPFEFFVSRYAVAIVLMARVCQLTAGLPVAPHSPYMHHAHASLAALYEAASVHPHPEYRTSSELFLGSIRGHVPGHHNTLRSDVAPLSAMVRACAPPAAGN